MRPIRYCASCGMKLPGEPTLTDGVECVSCGRTSYRNPSPTAGAAIVRGDEVLVTVRARDPYAGRADVPGGFLNAGEEIIEGLRRELREELGVEVSVGPEDFLQAEPHRYGDDGDWTIAFGFRARLRDGEPSASDDVADLMWVKEEGLDALEWAWPHDKELARRALELAREEGGRE